VYKILNIEYVFGLEFPNAQSQEITGVCVLDAKEFQNDCHKKSVPLATTFVVVVQFKIQKKINLVG